MKDVLIVDDEPGVTAAVSLMLKKSGIACRTASSVRKALAAVEAEWPGVVLLDLSLAGGKDGWQVWETLAQVGRGRPLAVIVFAAEINDQDQAEAARRGAAGVLRKTAGPKAIVEAVRHSLQRISPVPSVQTGSLE